MHLKKQPIVKPSTPKRKPLNLGPVSLGWLSSLGVQTTSDIEPIGSIEIYRQLQMRGFPVSLNHLYALEAAVMGVHWNKLPASVKGELRRLVGKESKRR